MIPQTPQQNNHRDCKEGAEQETAPYLTMRGEI